MNDNTIFDILDKSDFFYIIKNEIQDTSDNEKIKKINRDRIIIELYKNYELEIEVAKLFKADLEVDLNEYIEEQYKTFMEDLEKSQIGNFSTVLNSILY